MNQDDRTNIDYLLQERDQKKKYQHHHDEKLFKQKLVHKRRQHHCSSFTTQDATEGGRRTATCAASRVQQLDYFVRRKLFNAFSSTMVIKKQVNNEDCTSINEESNELGIRSSSFRNMKKNKKIDAASTKTAKKVTINHEVGNEKEKQKKREKLNDGRTRRLHDNTIVPVEEEEFEERSICEGNKESLKRKGLRICGFESYILISILSAQACFEEIRGKEVNWENIITTNSVYDFFYHDDWSKCGALMSAACSTIYAIYCAIVFSLVILYGKTALGLHRDIEFIYFINQTKIQRFHGFQAFTNSLFLCVLSVIFDVSIKVPMEVRYPFVIIATIMLRFFKTRL